MATKPGSVFDPRRVSARLAQKVKLASYLPMAIADISGSYCKPLGAVQSSVDAAPGKCFGAEIMETMAESEIESSKKAEFV